MATVSSAGKIAYIWDASTQTWFPLAGGTDPAANIPWTGTHTFSNTVTTQSVLNAKAGVNNFANATERATALGTTPQNGVTAYLRDTKQLYYFDNGSWRLFGDDANLSTKNASFTLSSNDLGKTLDLDAAVSLTVTVPKQSSTAIPVGAQVSFIQTGAGQVVFSPEDIDVIILSKGPNASPTVAGNRKISARYSPATLIKKDINVWILIGDLTA